MTTKNCHLKPTRQERNYGYCCWMACELPTQPGCSKIAQDLCQMYLLYYFFFFFFFDCEFMGRAAIVLYLLVELLTE